MPQKEARTTLRPIKLRAQHSAQIPNRNLHRIRRRALRLSGDIIRGPSQHDRRSGIDPRSC